MSVEDVINRIERGTRMKRPDGSIGGYVIEIDEWREIRAALRNIEPPHVWHADPCWCGSTHWDPGQ